MTVAAPTLSAGGEESRLSSSSFRSSHSPCLRRNATTCAGCVPSGYVTRAPPDVTVRRRRRARGWLLRSTLILSPAAVASSRYSFARSTTSTSPASRPDPLLAFPGPGQSKPFVHAVQQASQFQRHQRETRIDLRFH